MRRVPSRRPGPVRQAQSEAGVVIVLYEPVYPQEAMRIEKSVRATFPDWCPAHEWHQWTYDAGKSTLSVTAEVACEDPDQITTGLMYPAWDAIDHYAKVDIYLDALLWEHPFHRGDEEEYRVYIEETRLPAQQEEAEDLAREGKVHEARALLARYVERLNEQCRAGVPWSEDLLQYYREALATFDGNHEAAGTGSNPSDG